MSQGFSTNLWTEIKSNALGVLLLSETLLIFLHFIYTYSAQHSGKLFLTFFFQFYKKKSVLGAREMTQLVRYLHEELSLDPE